MGYCINIDISDISWDHGNFMIFHGIYTPFQYNMKFVIYIRYIRYIPWNIHDPRLPPVWVGYSLPPFCAGWFKSQPAFPWNYHSTPTFGRLNTPFVSICNLLIKDIPWYSHILLIFPVYSQYLRATIMLKTSSWWLPKFSCDPMALTTPLPHHGAAKHRRHSIGDSRPSLRCSSCPSPKRWPPKK